MKLYIQRSKWKDKKYKHVERIGNMKILKILNLMFICHNLL